MKSREVTLVSVAAIAGGIASAFAFHFFSKSRKLSTSSFNDVKDGPKQSPFDPSKRKGYLSWDDYFMAIAFLSAKRSKDPNRQPCVQVGACLVSQSGIILGIGYNGFPRGCSDDKLPWAKKSLTGDPLQTKYPYVCHAEVNAILNTNHASAAGQRLYVTMFPCNECAKVIIQSGVSEVIYFIEKKLDNSDAAYIASHRMLSMAGIKVRKHQPEMQQIVIQFE
ncbi:hypothetical protein AMTRI_Chr06g194230 [Amborella trichopoda]|uniref:deoxycytidylate deaminase isoform X1 n=1 Tax=Amborella trichopoda TaxID=13333 RepID=UPI0009BE6EE5|nr:deoxycytidylate deaminase isoform X1 [Amborella trichopoda]|eukprot:XP_020525560.1 deoxycytidylate deaminase isoform X1 [Amborella trichopoda]